LRHLFDWMVIGQIMPTNPAAAVRGPLHIVRRGKMPVLDPAEARQLIDAIDATTIIGLRDRALIGLMVSSFARIGAAINMRVEDVYTRRTAAFGFACTRKAASNTPCHAITALKPTFTPTSRARAWRTIRRRCYSRPTAACPVSSRATPCPGQRNAYMMIQRRSKSAGIIPRMGNDTFRATGVTAYLKNGGTLEKAAQMANHASTRTTQLYDRRAEEVTLDEVERILV
jgi:site-specific recombinase XerD